MFSEDRLAVARGCTAFGRDLDADHVAAQVRPVGKRERPHQLRVAARRAASARARSRRGGGRSVLPLGRSLPPRLRSGPVAPVGAPVGRDVACARSAISHPVVELGRAELAGVLRRRRGRPRSSRRRRSRSGRGRGPAGGACPRAWGWRRSTTCVRAARRAAGLGEERHATRAPCEARPREAAAPARSGAGPWSRSPRQARCRAKAAEPATQRFVLASKTAEVPVAAAPQPGAHQARCALDRRAHHVRCAAGCRRTSVWQPLATAFGGGHRRALRRGAAAAANASVDHAARMTSATPELPHAPSLTTVHTDVSEPTRVRCRPCPAGATRSR